MSQFINPQRVIEERNGRLMVWVADELSLAETKREKLYVEMALLFHHATENEVAEYLWEKLASKNVIKDVAAAKRTMKHFQGIAHSWLSNTSEAQRD